MVAGRRFLAADRILRNGAHRWLRPSVQAIFLIAAALAVAISTRYLDIEGEQHGEYYALVLFATVGMLFLACGYDLIVLYVSLELMALTFYVLVAFTKREKRSNEAAMKYFLLGAFSSGICSTACPCSMASPAQQTSVRSHSLAQIVNSMVDTTDTSEGWHHCVRCCCSR